MRCMHGHHNNMKQKKMSKLIMKQRIERSHNYCKLTVWSIDEMQAWSPYMKQKDRKKS